MEITTVHKFSRHFRIAFSLISKNENVEFDMKEIVDYIEMNCYNRDTIGLHHLFDENRFYKWSNGKKR